MEPTPNWPFEPYLPLLRVQARDMYHRLHGRIRRRFSADDLVGEVLLKVCQCQGQFRGQTKGERVQWLMTILVNTFRDVIAFHTAGKRDVGCDLPIHDPVGDASERWSRFLAGTDTSPSSHVAREELLLRIARAIDALPPSWRDVMLLHYRQDTSVDGIAAELGLTPKAVASILYRAKTRLREELKGVT